MGDRHYEWHALTYSQLQTIRMSDSIKYTPLSKGDRLDNEGTVDKIATKSSLNCSYIDFERNLVWLEGPA